jgi:hypothetical protein
LQQFVQRGDRSFSIIREKVGSREAKPSFARIVPVQQFARQANRADRIGRQQRRCERDGDGRIVRREPARAFEPVERILEIARRDGVGAGVEGLERERSGFVATSLGLRASLSQWLTAGCGSRWALAAGGRAARSWRTS